MCASQCKLPHHFHSLLNGVTVTVAIWAKFQLSHPLLSRYPSSRLCNWDPGAPSIIRTLCGDDISLIWLVTPVPNRIRLMVKVTTVTAAAGIPWDHPSISSWEQLELHSLMSPTIIPRLSSPVLKGFKFHPAAKEALKDRPGLPPSSSHCFAGGKLGHSSSNSETTTEGVTVPNASVRKSALLTGLWRLRFCQV